MQSRLGTETRLISLAVVSMLTMASVCIGQAIDALPTPAPLEKESNLINADLVLVNDHDPQVEQVNFEMLDGFEVNLFAADPMLANPVHMVWSPEGKLYVACSWAYPQLKPGEPANDKIIVLEDTDGDGRADTSTVFADGLYLPTGLELANGGVYVAQTPHILFLKDTTGDGRADVREIALTGFGIEDSHHSISAWRRGPGGWIYFQEGKFLNTQIETPYGTVRNFDGGVYQFNPRSGELRVFANISVGNPWGHVFDEWGQSFLVDNPRIIYLTPTTGNHTKKRNPFVLAATEKQCGGDLISGSHMPPEMHGQLLSGRFKSRTVIRYEISDDRAGYTANVLEPLMSSKHPNFRPVDVKMGPDGAVYVADWYNSIINHAQHDFRDPRRDQEHGRIWRITATNRPLINKPQLVGQSLPTLLEHLKSPEAWTRQQTRKVISEMPPGEVARELAQWVAQLESDDSLYDQHLIEAIWTYQNIGNSDEAVLRTALQARTGQARAAAARVLRYWHPHVSDPVSLLKEAASDPFPRVRLEAVLSAGFVPDGRALVAALHALDHPLDPYIEAALEQTVNGLARYVSNDLEFAKAEHAEYAKLHAGTDVAMRLNLLLREGSRSMAEVQLICQQFVRVPTKPGVRLIVDALVSPNNTLSSELTLELLNVLTTVGRRKHFAMEQVVEPLISRLNNVEPAILVTLLETLTACEAKQAAQPIIELLKEPSQPKSVRIVAARSVVQLASSVGVATLSEMANNGAMQPVEQEIAVHGLLMIEPGQAARLAAYLLANHPTDVDAIQMVEAFLQRPGGSDALTQAVSTISPHPSVLADLAGYFNQTGTLPESLATYLRPSRNPKLLAELLQIDAKQLGYEASQRGNPFAGEMVYRRKQLACTSCHAIAQVGPQLAPDLAAVGSAADTAYIVDSILRPDKAIAEHFEAVAVQTIDGQILKGIVVFRNEDEIVVRDPSRAEPVRVAMDDVTGIRPVGSLMPTGLVETLADKQEFLDLVSFLSQLGRPGPFATTTRPVIKLWRALSNPRPARELSLDRIPAASTWSSLYSQVNGELPSTDWVYDSAIDRSTFLKNSIHVQRSGKVLLKFNSTSGLRVWIGGREVVDFKAPQSLAVGQQELMVLIDNAVRGTQGLRVELVDDPSETARYQLEMGE